MKDLRKYELLELYKLHAELADRVSHRREGANRLFVSLLVGLMLFLGILVRFGVEGVPVAVVLLFAELIGIALSASWFIVIRSYRQLNSGKFRALRELENELAFSFFKREWDYLEAGEKLSRYWKLSIVETSLPIIFFVLSLILALSSLFLLGLRINLM